MKMEPIKIDFKQEIKDAFGQKLDNIPDYIKPVLEKAVYNEMGDQVIGVQETSDVIEFGVSLTNALLKAMPDGITFSDAPIFIPAIMKLPAALGGIEKVPAEIADLDDEELNKMLEFIKGNLELNDHDSERILVGSLDVLKGILTILLVIWKNRKLTDGK